jgi:protein-S-isoprenylcysteine O-methyltransferase Ste14
MLRGGENPAPHKSTAQLVTGGPFRFSRNPIYAGGTTALLGLAVLLDTATGIAVAVLLGFLAHSVAVAEERYLEAKFGDESFLMERTGIEPVTSGLQSPNELSAR